MTPAGPVLQLLAGCDFCRPGTPTEGKLFALLDGRRVCAFHWNDMGRPWPRENAGALQAHEAEAASKARMARRAR